MATAQDTSSGAATAAVTESSSAERSERPRSIVVYRGEEYDVTTFVPNHPGGAFAILEYVNKDMTHAFDEVGHSDTAIQLLQKYKVTKGSASSSAVSTTTTTTSAVSDSEKRHALRAEIDKEIADAYGLKFTTRKLFTEEDKYFIHKTFGLLSLLSFAYRYLYVWPTTGTLGFDGHLLDHATLLLHFLLSSSSLIFHVLERRITQNPLIIYEEYRLHAIAFTMRTVLVSLIGMHQRSVSPTTARWALVAAMLFSHVVVDLITYKYGTKGVTAVRNTQEKTLRKTKLFFSYYQFCMTGASLLLSDRLADVGFNAIIAIQSSAFLMTLKRKNLIRWPAYTFWYSGALLLSMGFVLQHLGLAFLAAILLVFSVRARFHLDKYLVWSVYTLAASRVIAIDPRMYTTPLALSLDLASAAKLGLTSVLGSESLWATAAALGAMVQPGIDVFTSILLNAGAKIARTEL